MDAFAAAPPPGTAAPGNLYVDLQTRSLWLGVDTDVDPVGAVLVSDMLALQSEIDGALVESKAYTDAQILTRAPTVHTHNSSQITDFEEAVVDVAGSIPGLSFIRGMVMMYSGSIADVGVGDLAGWALCDGSNGTPNLRDRFVIGAGNKIVGAINSLMSLVTAPSQGGHDHIVNGTAISIAQMPAHNHTPGTGGESTDHAHYVSGVTDVQGNHVHGPSQGAGFYEKPPGAGPGYDGGNGTYTVTGSTAAAGNHQHNVNIWSGGRNAGHTHAVYTQGGGEAHTHTIVGGGGAHQHTIPAADLREVVPYYALAFIMKL